MMELIYALATIAALLFLWSIADKLNSMIGYLMQILLELECISDSIEQRDK